MNSFGTPARNIGIDALRAALTLLVVFHHAAITYGGSGSWFYQEIAPSNLPSSLALTVFCTLNQAFFMGLFFLIAGSMTPAAIDRRGARGFIGERLSRLGLPLLIFGLVLGPLTAILGQCGEGVPLDEAIADRARRGWFVAGPMWFVEALLILSSGYLALRAALGPGSLERPRPFPSNMVLAAAALGTGAAAFLLRLCWPVGESVLALQLGYVASYVVLFLAGCVGAGGRWLDAIPPTRMRAWASLSALAALALVAMVVAAAMAGGDLAAAQGGWNGLAVFYAFWEPLFAWGAILAALALFQRLFVTLGPLGSRLARRAYLIFILHPPILVGASLALAGLAAPALLKTLLAASAACALSFLLAGALLLLPAVRRVA